MASADLLVNGVARGGGKIWQYAPDASHEGTPNGPKNKKLLNNFYFFEWVGGAENILSPGRK